MTTRTALAVANPAGGSWANLVVARNWKPRITNAVPVVRWAILVRVDPPLTDTITHQIHSAFEKNWPSFRELYRAAVAERAGIDVSDLVIDPQEIVRLRYDGDTPMIDLPKVQTVSGEDFSLDLRNCAALCLKDYSSKIWTRVGLPYQYQIEHGCDVDDLPGILDRYRSLAKSMAEWFHDELVRFAEPFLEGRNRKVTGALEVTAVGLRVDNQPKADFDVWLFDGHAPGEPLSSSTVRPNLENEDLRYFITQAANLDYDVRDLSTREPDAFWMSMPMAIELQNGDLASRNTLYLVRPVGEVVQIVGVGLDDSRAGDFASEVALKLSRVVANRF